MGTITTSGKNLYILQSTFLSLYKLLGFNTMPVNKEIDQLVYQLYGLTEEEIKIVEGG
jgi:hypothetical protein